MVRMGTEDNIEVAEAPANPNPTTNDGYVV
jgi:hypothetical protein